MDGERPKTVPIAIVGMSCRFAGDATSPEKLWSMVSEGRSAWTEIPSWRFNVDGVYHPRAENLSTTNVRGGHFLTEDVGLFDAGFFGLSTETASSMDPQYRLQMESVYEALENAGLPMEKVSGSNTSVFAGVFFHDYLDSNMRDTERLPRMLMTGNGSAMASNRVSHFFNLAGPSMTIDTGCSTALTAIHQGCQSLITGDASMSVVCASNLLLNPDYFVSMSSLGLISPDGKSYAFDSRANGYGRGEGVATIILKRLDDALRDGDPIRAVVRQTTLNQDGKTETITSPSQHAQELLIRETYKRAGLDFGAIQYFEAHGTGTPTGDPIEVGAIASVFQHGRSPANPLYIGSVKTNVGHTEPTSGLASVIKVAMAMENGIIPPSINFEKPNKKLSLDEWNLKVPRKCEEWRTGPDGIRRASVNNFGYGGSNSHIIMESWSSPRRPINTSRALQNGHTNGHSNGHTNGNGHPSHLSSKVFTLSGKDEQTCRAIVSNLKTHLQGLKFEDKDHEAQFLDDLAHTLGERRTRFPLTATSTAGSVAELVNALDADGKFKPTRASDKPVRIGFVFTGQGAQWHAMGRELFEAYPVFKASILEADGYLKEFGCRWSLYEELHRDAETSQVGSVLMSMPICVAVQISLVHLLESWNITPAAISSHSSGEIAAACAAGALSYRSAMAASYGRSEAASESAMSNDKGGMLAVGMGRETAEELLKQVKHGKASVACVNSPSSITMSGDLSAIEEFEVMAKKQNMFARRLRVEAAFHSHHMEPINDLYVREMKTLGVGREKQVMKDVRYGSPTTGTRITDSSLLNGPEHWARSMVQPVLFVDAFREMALDSETGETVVDCVIEVGPHAALAGPIGDILTLPEFQGSNIIYLSCLVRKSSALSTMQSLVCQLLGKGAAINMRSVNFPSGQQSARVLTDLPPYPWNHQVRHWAEPRENLNRRERLHAPHDLIGSLVDGTNLNAPTWRKVIRAAELPWVRQHTVQGSILYPGAGYITMAIEAACQITDPRDEATAISGYRLRDVDIQSALVIPDGLEGADVHITLKPVSNKTIGLRGWKEFQVSSVSPENKWTEHCTGFIQVVLRKDADDVVDGRSVSLPKFPEGSLRDINPEAIFSAMRSVGIYHGPIFQNLGRVQVTDNQAVNIVSIADVLSTMPASWQHPHVLHPTTLDSVLVSAYTATKGAGTEMTTAKVPKSIKNMWVSHDISSAVGYKFRAHASIDAEDSKSFRSSVSLFDDIEDGVCSLTLGGLVCQSLGAAIPPPSEPYKDEICSTIKWAPAMSLMDPAFLKNDLSYPAKPEDAVIIMDLRRACYHYLHEALGRLSISDVRQLEGHDKKFYAWMALQEKLAERNELGPESSKWAEDSDEEKRKLFDVVAAASVNGELVCRVGPHIETILKHEVTPLELMMEDKLLFRYYSTSPKFDRANRQLGKMVGHLVRENPEARILEIGGGTGGATRFALNEVGNRKLGVGPLASEYHFTDVSSGFFADAQESFADWSDIFSCRKLDIETDPTGQGFETGHYDIIIACQVLHATKDMQNTMTNVRTLLKPGGKLLLAESTKDHMDLQFAFGLLPGWWLSVEPERNMSPSLTLDHWDRVLKATNFSGVEFEVHDCDSEEQYSFSAMISTAADPAPQTPTFDPVVLVAGGELPNGSGWLQALKDSIAVRTGASVTVVESLNSAKDEVNKKTCVFLGELFRPLLIQPSEKEFEDIKALALSCKSLLWVTRGGAVDCKNPWAAMASGFFRTLRTEYTGKDYAVLDLDPERPAVGEVDIAAITGLLVSRTQKSTTLDVGASADYEFAERAGIILIPRLYHDIERNKFISTDTSQAPEPQKELFQQPGRPLKLGVGIPGSLETLVFSDDPQGLRELDPEYIEIQPKAFGQNFRDVMAAMGRLNEIVMGLECAGVITRVGSNAALRGYNVGDSVFALLDGQYTSLVQLSWTTAHRMPPEMDFTTAASVPMAFATAYISLFDKARLCKGQSVLIHAASGGVGQAAIMLAQLVGAEVFATAGTPEKRDFIHTHYGIPEDHIFSSRSGSFLPKLLSKTGGRGVDVVLNSLAGNLLQDSFNALASFGHFVEIGKFDLEHNHYLEMVPFSRAVSFSAVDVLAMCRRQGPQIQSALSAVARLWEQKLIRAVYPVTTVPISQIEKGFRQMQAGKHMGKIVITVGPEDVVSVVPRKPSVKLREDASYLIVGGMGGIGKAVAQWMLSRGAKNLILLSRSAGAKEETKAFIAELEKVHRGSKVKAIDCDISQSESLKLALESCSEQMPAIRGVIQGAMVLHDSVIEQMTLAQYEGAVRPKVQGSWNLHEHLGPNLDFFVMLSSIAGIIGNASQSNYSAGGAYQDALARYRAAQGLAAVSIDLGAVKNIGYVAEHQAVNDRLTRRGHRALSEEEVLGAVESALLRDSPQVVLGINTAPGPQWDPNNASPMALETRFVPLRYREPSKADGGASKASQRSGNLAGKLAAASSLDEAATLVAQELMRKLVDIFVLSPEEMQVTKSMAAFGVDSLVAVELRSLLALQAGAELSVFDIMQSTSLQTLAKTVASASIHVKVS
ncbi:hypothetical protein B0T22DRAFT_430696 [Podospora appendiculata]|uniref:Polyketide synthase n=1 Tax=Podospora appendiculata TaxID=314037 RepID=A0AAE0X2E9_9PEZI|nr:hypothetical protein B0T22DRAFT_430696 [Podospora appendiculata]